MRYFEDMLDKYGFGDGSSQPVGIEEFRTCYVRALNVFLAKTKSKFRVAAYNRAGMHNGCMILICLAKDLEDKGQDEIESGELSIKNSVRLDRVDEAYREAVLLAEDADLDGFIHVECQLDNACLDEMLERVAQEEVS